MATLDCWQALWRALKAVIRALTRRGELERLLTAGDYDSGMGRAVGDAFRRSRQLQGVVADMASDGTAEDAAFATRIVTLKRISFAEPTFNARTLPNLLACIRAFRGSKAAAAAGAKLAAVKYDVDNAHHEALLLALWRGMRPGVELTARKSKQWTDLGFQGTDPASDFRGMGLLGLYQLLHLARWHADHVREVVAKTDLPFKGYPLALLSITMTQWALEEARGAALDAALSASLAASPAAAPPSSAHAGAAAHVDTEAAGAGGAAATAAPSTVAPVPLSVATGGAVSDSSGPALAALHDVIARLTVLFDAHWYTSAPSSMMEFPDVFASFKRRVQRDMAASGGLLPHQPAAGLDDRGVAPVDARAGTPSAPRALLPPGLAFVPSAALAPASTSTSSSVAGATGAGGRTAVRQVFVQQRRGDSAASDGANGARDDVDDDDDDADDAVAAARPLKGGR